MKLSDGDKAIREGIQESTPGMIIGFTGTRHGLTVLQHDALAHTLSRMDFLVGVHGDCIGADAIFHQFCVNRGAHTWVHPGFPRNDPDDTSYRAFCKGDIVEPPEPYFARNRKIIARCDLLIACPAGLTPQQGGTWYTIRYAQAEHKNHIIIDQEAEIYYYLPANNMYSVG